MSSDHAQATQDTQTRKTPPAEATAQQSEQESAQDELIATEDPEMEDKSFSPRGTLLFLLVMLLGYALYWAYLWFIVVIERGAGGGF
jgi:hypothetical protein